MSSGTPTGTSYGDLAFVATGPIDESLVRAAAEAQMSRLAARAPRPVLFARVKVRSEAHRPEPERVIAQGSMDVSGTIIRAEGAAPSALEALNGMFDHLDRRLTQLTERRENARGRPPATPPGSWRHGDLPDVRPTYFERPDGQRQIVRTKTFAPDRITIEEALFDLEVLDHRFFLFTDSADGADSVVYEEGGGVMLRRVSGGAPAAGQPLAVQVNPAPTPTLSPDEAATQLDLSEAPFVFFRDGATGRAAVIYRRYDGHYGLVAPA